MMNDRIARGFFYLNFCTSLLWIGPFYLSAYLLTPRLFYQRQYVLFVSILVLMYGVVLMIHMLLFRYVFFLPHFSFAGATGFLLPAYILTLAVSITFRFVADKAVADELAKERQEENLKTELSFLRSQINPHFIFNILNNLVALEQMKSPELGATILKLSSLMQYMLYDTDEEQVPLNKEVEYLQSYIDLQRQRFGAKVPISVSLDSDPGFYEIEPMLLIPFVENAFKHGVAIGHRSSIALSITASPQKLFFTCENTDHSAVKKLEKEKGGIGLENVKRRLELLYPGRHELSAGPQNGNYMLNLQIDIL